MPLSGTMTVEEAGLPEVGGFDTEPLVLPRTDVLHAMFEIDSSTMEAILPSSMHPTIPPTVTFFFWKSTGSELGDFTYGQVRIGCRAGVRPRGYLIAGFIDNPAAGEQLTRRWGFRCDEADVALKRYYDRLIGTVVLEGSTVLDVELVDPEAVAGSDIFFVANMNPARTPSGPRLVQVDPEYVMHKAERGSPALRAFDAAACGDERVEPRYGVSAAATVSDISLPRIRYVCRVDVPALQGTEKVG